MEQEKCIWNLHRPILESWHLLPYQSNLTNPRVHTFRVNSYKNELIVVKRWKKKLGENQNWRNWAYWGPGRGGIEDWSKAEEGEDEPAASPSAISSSGRAERSAGFIVTANFRLDFDARKRNSWIFGGLFSSRYCRNTPAFWEFGDWMFYC